MSAEDLAFDEVSTELRMNDLADSCWDVKLHGKIVCNTTEKRYADVVAWMCCNGVHDQVQKEIEPDFDSTGFLLPACDATRFPSVPKDGCVHGAPYVEGSFVCDHGNGCLSWIADRCGDGATWEDVPDGVQTLFGLYTNHDDGEMQNVADFYPRPTDAQMWSRNVAIAFSRWLMGEQCRPTRRIGSVE